jgi:predicted tellurium resistance membrane protein TerC
MAVVFISPKQRQKMFFLGITVMFLLFLIIISLGVFLSKPKEILPVMVFNEPKVNIDMSVFNSDQFKNLRPFPEMETQYSYKATTKNNQPETGFISAISIDQARTILESMGLTVSELKEVKIGRDNPFTSYY